jgi:hypothetical protein
MQQPQQAVYNMVYRPLAAEMFNFLIDCVLNDSVMYNRLRQILMQQHPTSPHAFEALIAKAETAGIELTKILEVYDNGFRRDFPAHLTPEQRAFNAVNSFIANEMQLDPHKREQGTDDLVNTYIKDTPGQSKINTIRKALKGKKNA